jgi:hypothetical protein
MNTKSSVCIYIYMFFLFPLLYYNYSFIYLYKGYASYIHISRGYMKHKRLRTTVVDNRLTDGSEVFSLMRQPPFTPRKIPGTHFCKTMIRPQGHSAVGRIRSIEKSNDLIGNQTRDLPACSVLPQPTALPRVPLRLQ